MKKRIVYFILCLCMLFSMSSCDSEGGAEAIEVGQEHITLAKGEKRAISYSVYPLTAKNDSVEWESDNEDIAIVKGGVVSAKEVGRATITAKTKEHGHSAFVMVEVIEDALTVSKNFNKETVGYGLYNFDNINSALACAEKGEKIRVLEGEYDEVINITENVDLEGIGATLSSHIYIGVNGLKSPVTEVLIDGFTFTNDKKSALNSKSALYIGSGNSGVVIRNCRFIGEEGRKGHQYAIETLPASSSSAVSKIKITDCEFEGFSYAINFNPLVSMAEVRKNTFENCRFAVNLMGGQRLKFEENQLTFSGLINLEKSVLPPSSIRIKHNNIKSVYQSVGDELGASHLLHAKLGTLDKSEEIDLTENQIFGIDPIDMTDNQRQALLAHIYIGRNREEDSFSNIILKKKTFFEMFLP